MQVQIVTLFSNFVLPFHRIMGALAIHPPLTNLQFELLKLFARQVPEADLLAIRDMIAQYLLEKTFSEADQAWVEKGYTVESFQEKLHESQFS